jgi:hypothetical protein
MRAQAHHSIGQLRVVGERDASLRCGDDLDRMKAENCDIGITASADRHSVVEQLTAMLH